MNGQTIFALLASCAGACIALQAAANGTLRRHLDNPYSAAFLSICGTFTTALLGFLVLRPPLPTPEVVRQTQWWNWIGGPLGALIVLAGAALTPRLGAATFIAFVVGGQLLCSVFLDHFALMGLPEQPLTPGRVVGALLVVGGMLCIKYA